jgi:hypothetical protein
MSSPRCNPDGGSAVADGRAWAASVNVWPGPVASGLAPSGLAPHVPYRSEQMTDQRGVPHSRTLARMSAVGWSFSRSVLTRSRCAGSRRSTWLLMHGAWKPAADGPVADRREPASDHARRQHRANPDHGLEDHTELDRDRNRGPRHTPCHPAQHGGAGRLDHHRSRGIERIDGVPPPRLPSKPSSQPSLPSAINRT